MVDDDGSIMMDFYGCWIDVGWMDVGWMDDGWLMMDGWMDVGWMDVGCGMHVG